MNRPIRFRCECGEGFSAEPSKVGQPIRCQRCGADLWVPDPDRLETPEEVVDQSWAGSTVPRDAASKALRSLAIGCSIALLCCCGVPILLSPFLPKEEIERPARPLVQAGAPADPFRGVGRSLRKRVESITVDEGVVFIRFRIADNLTAGLARIRAEQDVTDLLQALHSSELEFQKVNIVGLFPLEDKLGNERLTAVITLTYSRVLLDQINWKNFRSANVFDIAEPSYVHARFQ